MEGIVGTRGMSKSLRSSAVKITRGLYAPQEPTPLELAHIVTKHWPDLALDGYSAANLYLGKPLRFPLQLARKNGLSNTRFFQCRRAKPVGAATRQGIRVCNPLQITEIMGEEDATYFLEEHFAGPRGHELVHTAKKDFHRLTLHSQRALDTAVIGADSHPERQLSKALRTYFDVRNNVRLAGYRWDVFIEKHNIAIEVDGFAHHRRDDRRQFEIDHHKLNDASLAGYRLLRFTATTIEFHLGYAVDQVRALAAGRHPTSQPPWQWHWLWRHENDPYNAL
ncbi:endonuclease domain-containing protein [Corynebacterium sp.]|uniref:endonuclease domain-containing protein n=1 Tax=Corynebacterium sp. TaxID=1720 RepID=UPI0026DC031B|nr:DUF559 domain-containing protein [Corynebacterium sp.]MDO5031986.1 DUF559 domain-containing protein [Corynebacterium sp.]